MKPNHLHTPLGIVIISTADWDNPYWTNKQHVSVQLASRGHRILYVESPGLRPPTATRKDLKRLWRRLKKGLRPARQAHPGIWVWSPLVIPFHKYKIIRSINNIILNLGVLLFSIILKIEPNILWTYLPITTKLYRLGRYDLIIYHAVDDIAAQPHMPAEVIEAGEADLARVADLIFTTAPNLQKRLVAQNPNTHYFSNVADFDHFNRALDCTTEIPEDIAAIPGPRIGFVGAISSYKLDFEMIRELAAMSPEWSFVFIGEVGEGDPLTDVEVIRQLPNLHFLGGKRYSSLPAYLKAIDVAILPNKLNDYTRSMFPMKFFEYLAAGRPVVSARLHALSNMEHVTAFADDAKSFTVAIQAALDGRAPNLEDRLEAARQKTYDRRTEDMMVLIYSVLSAKTV